MRQHARRERHHLIARPGRARHVEGAMRRRAPAPQIVVVHAGEVIVHQRIGMNDFDRGRELRDTRGRRAVEGLVRREDERGAKAFPFPEQAVADHVVPALCPGRQHRVHSRTRVGEITS